MNRSQALGKALKAKNPQMPAAEVGGIVGKIAREKGQAPGQPGYVKGGRPARKGK